jgi:isopentenyl-diphosphate delta-isomerase type 1
LSRIVAAHSTEYVILVDEYDRELGQAEKMLAHQQAWCHRAFSVFVFRKIQEGALDIKNIEFLIQQRQTSKYHCGGLWTNTCCSHPKPKEWVVEGAERRLKEEMGITLSLTSVGAFHYIAKFENGLTENEYDHVLVGEWLDNAETHTIQPDPLEIQDYRWMHIQAIEQDLLENPTYYTPWFKPALKLALQGLACWQEDSCHRF